MGLFSIASAVLNIRVASIVRICFLFVVKSCRLSGVLAFVLKLGAVPWFAAELLV